MTYTFIITVFNGSSGHYTDSGEITVLSGLETRTMVYNRIFRQVCRHLNLRTDRTSVEFFYLEPAELEAAR